MPANIRPYLPGLPRQRTFEGVRIGEFLKELDLTEGRATGIPKILKVMALNGSPVPVFESNDERTSFVIRLPVHPEALVTSTVVTPEATGEATGEVTGEVERLLLVLNGEMPRQQIQQSLGVKHEDHFRKAYLVPALAAHVIEMTLPDTPRSSKQRYRLTGQGLQRRREIEARP